MSPITIIVTDGIKTALIVDGKRINGVGEISFHHKATEAAEISVSISNYGLPSSDIGDTLLSEAAKQLGYEVAAK